MTCILPAWAFKSKVNMTEYDVHIACLGIHIKSKYDSMTCILPAWAFKSKVNMNRLHVVKNQAVQLIRDYDRDTRIEQLLLLVSG